MTLFELLAAIALMLMVMAVMVPGLSNILMLEQRSAAREIALTYEQLHDLAVLRNQTFRVTFDLDAGAWQVEIGDPGAMIFSDPDAREEWEDNKKEREDDMTDQERAEARARHEFKKAAGVVGANKKLPEGTFFKSVYTPQYEHPVEYREPEDRSKQDDEDDRRVAASYIFANGFAEFTVIQVAMINNPDDGFTVTVDPLSGRVELLSELVGHEDAWDWLPDEGPSLPQ